MAFHSAIDLHIFFFVKGHEVLAVWLRVTYTLTELAVERSVT